MAAAFGCLLAHCPYDAPRVLSHPASRWSVRNTLSDQATAVTGGRFAVGNTGVACRRVSVTLSQSRTPAAIAATSRHPITRCLLQRATRPVSAAGITDMFTSKHAVREISPHGGRGPAGQSAGAARARLMYRLGRATRKASANRAFVGSTIPLESGTMRNMDVLGGAK